MKSSDRGSPRVHVVAAVLTDAGGRILLAQRPGHRDLPGCWEFPGGKVEPGETAGAALVRELHEELGIVVDPDGIVPLIAVPQACPDKRIVLDVFRVERWTGTPRGLEQQPLRWVPAAALAANSMPPADRPVVAALMQPKRYLITPEPIADPALFLHGIERALAAGIRRIQLRARNVPGAALRTLAIQVRDRCQTGGAELLLNSGSDGSGIALARELEVGVHLRAAALRAVRQRPLPGFVVAASCHDGAELRLAHALGVDFVTLGPVCATASHPDAAPLGWDAFARLREAVPLPIYALGGLVPADLAQARRHGAQGIAAIRGLWPD